MTSRIATVIAFLLLSTSAFALGQPRYVQFTAGPGAFPVASGKTAATLWVDSSDWPGVVRS
jgi:hypothetical protein